MHTHTWHIFSTDVTAHSLTVYCPCGAVAEAQRVSAEALQALLEAAAVEWDGPVEMLAA